MSVVPAASQAPQPSAKPTFVAGIDSLRFFAAAMVAICHLARNLPVAPPGATETQVFHQLALVANGQAAVGLFFVISGFCIHLGQSTDLKVEALPFLIKRTVRIGLPLIIVSSLAAACGSWATAALNSVLWSLYCELAYYLAYPMLLACRRKMPMAHLLMAAMLVSAILVSLQPKHDFLQDYGLATALICYPLWLAGAWLAERHGSVRLPLHIPIHLWRLAAFSLCWIFPFGPYGPIDVSAAVKLGLVGVFSLFYIPAELARWRATRVSTWSESLGRCSYSLYLVHILPVAYFMLAPIGISFWPAVIVETAAIAGVTWIAYRLFEEPAQRLAKVLGRMTMDSSWPRSGIRAS